MSLTEPPRGFVTMTEHHRALEEIDRLRDRLRDLREEFASLTSLKAMASFTKSLSISPMEARVLIALIDRPGSVDDLMRRTHCPSHRSIWVYICRLRTRFSALGAPPKPIEHIRANGYWLSHEARQWLSNRVPEAFTEQRGRSA